MCTHFLKKSLFQAFQKEESGDGNTKNVVKEVGMWPWVPRGPQPESPGSREGALGLSAWALQPDLVLLRSCWEDVHRTDLGKSHTHSSAQRAEGTCERHTLWGSRGKRKVPRYVVGLSVGSWLLLFAPLGLSLQRPLLCGCLRAPSGHKGHDSILLTAVLRLVIPHIFSASRTIPSMQ